MSSKQKKMIILGVDPGTLVTGYGVIRDAGNNWEPLDFGCIRPPAKLKIELRYLAIFEGIDLLLEKYQPEAVSVETQFVYKNVQSALKLGMARGAVIIAAARRGIEVFEYAPTKAKLAIVGSGGASKFQVQKMIQMQLKLTEMPEPADAADALALALCHAHTRKAYV
jgi:crossover junction endodeoxyribonuclease RuvC